MPDVSVAVYRGGTRAEAGSVWVRDGKAEAGEVLACLEEACSLQGEGDSCVVSLEDGMSGRALDAWVCESGVVVSHEGPLCRAGLTRLVQETEEGR